MTKNILFISDMQIPYHHKDSVAFLKLIKEVYRPSAVYNVGDLVDSHTLSFHEVSPNMMGPSDEILQSRKVIKQLAQLFPVMKIAIGNHDLRVLRKARNAGIPDSCIKSLAEIYEAPKGWEFKNDFLIDLPNKEKVYMIHNCGHSDAVKGVQSYGYSVVQGHHHTNSVIQYVSSRDKLMFGATIGCLIDDKALAFEYNKLQIKRPILSVMMIIGSVPVLIPMVLNKQGKWIGRLI